MSLYFFTPWETLFAFLLGSSFLPFLLFLLLFLFRSIFLNVFAFLQCNAAVASLLLSSSYSPFLSSSLFVVNTFLILLCLCVFSNFFSLKVVGCLCNIIPLSFRPSSLPPSFPPQEGRKNPKFSNISYVHIALPPSSHPLGFTNIKPSTLFFFLPSSLISSSPFPPSL